MGLQSSKPTFVLFKVRFNNILRKIFLRKKLKGNKKKQCAWK
jgi:hypothetical protein